MGRGDVKEAGKRKVGEALGEIGDALRHSRVRCERRGKKSIWEVGRVNWGRLEAGRNCYGSS